MYRPPQFNSDDLKDVCRLIRENAFAVLVTQDEGAMEATHLPLYLEGRDDGDGGITPVLYGHVSRSNTQWHMFDGENEALAVFSGAHTYVSPTWYETTPSVPTWNYETVHVYGAPRILDDPEDAWNAMRGLAEIYEPPYKSTWRLADLPEAFKAGQLQGIVAFEIPVARFECKLKLSQNRSDQDRENVAEALAKSDDGASRAIARRMTRVLAREREQS